MSLSPKSGIKSLLRVAAWCAISWAAGGAADLGLKAKYDPIIQKTAARYSVNPSLVHSIIAAESDYDRYAVSSKGALGLMQLMPDTAAAYGVRDVFDPASNIEGGVKFLRDMLEEFDNDLERALAAYNAGHKAVKKYDGVPPFPETRNYVRNVQKNFRLESLSRKTKLFEFRDKQGRIVLTNDPRLAAGPN